MWPEAFVHAVVMLSCVGFFAFVVWLGHKRPGDTEGGQG